MKAYRRLNGREIGILRSLLKRGGHRFAIALHWSQRWAAVDLWRRGLVEVWYRQAPDAAPSLQGPYYALSLSGLRLASHFAAPRQGRQGR